MANDKWQIINPPPPSPAANADVAASDERHGKDEKCVSEMVIEMSYSE